MSFEQHVVLEFERDSNEIHEPEMVVVCQPLVPDFCVEFVPPPQFQVHPNCYRQFTLHLPQHLISDQGVTRFVISIASGLQTFLVERRYSEFVALSRTLSVPWNLPPKTWFPSTEATFLHERRLGLEQSLYRLLADTPEVVQLPSLRDFLCLDVFGVQVLEEKRECMHPAGLVNLS